MTSTFAIRSAIGTRTASLAVACVAVAALAALCAPAPAHAGLGEEFAVFSDCPINTPGVTECVFSDVTSGEFTLGSKTVAIDKPVILQGGLKPDSPNLVPAADGDTLSPTALTVPGGLVGIEGLGGEVTATAELAGTVVLNSVNLLAGHGIAVSLPLKVKLDNPVLLSDCHIGSEEEPVSLQLTTGTTEPPGPNEPISGNPGGFIQVAGGLIVFVPTSTLVDNAFAVPGANGCGPLPLVTDPLVDVAAGVPAAAGHNTAIMTGSLSTASVAAVKAHAALPEIGRCVEAPSTGSGKAKVYSGGFRDKACSVEESGHAGRYEWTAGPGVAKAFTGKGGKTTLEGVAGGQVRCTGSTLAGEYTGPKSATATDTLTGCERASSKQPCQSSGAAAGEVVSSPLAGSLDFISDEAKGSEVVASVGLDVSHQPSLLSAECDGVNEPLVVTGSVIAPIGKLDKMSSSFTAKFTDNAGHQVPERFELGSPDTLTATLGAGAEAAGLSGSIKLVNGEPLEIKAIQR